MPKKTQEDLPPFVEPRLDYESVPTLSGSVDRGKGLVDLFRAKVPGGWFVFGANKRSGFFYPDPEHLWWRKCLRWGKPACHGVIPDSRSEKTCSPLCQDLHKGGK